MKRLLPVLAVLVALGPPALGESAPHPEPYKRASADGKPGLTLSPNLTEQDLQAE